MLQWWLRTQKTSKDHKIPLKSHQKMSKDTKRHQKTSKGIIKASKGIKTHQKASKDNKRLQKTSKDFKKCQKALVYQNKEKDGHPNEVHTRRKVQKNIQINETNMLQRWHRRCLTS